jgi:hypothetical protein
VLVVYYQDRLVPKQLHAITYNCLDNVWTEPADISDTGKSIAEPNAASSPDDGYWQMYVWVEIDSVTGHSVVMGRISGNNGLILAGPFPISDPSEDAGNPQVDFSRVNTAVVTYDVVKDSTKKKKMATVIMPTLQIPTVRVTREPDDTTPAGVTEVFGVTSWKSLGSKSLALAPAAPEGTLEPVLLFIWTAPPPDDYLDDVFVGTFVLAGDTDCNGGVDSLDALAVLRSVAALPPPAGCLAAGDVNCSGGSADSIDALTILRFAAHLPNTLPADCADIGT